MRLLTASFPSSASVYKAATHFPDGSAQPAYTACWHSKSVLGLFDKFPSFSIPFSELHWNTSPTLHLVLNSALETLLRMLLWSFWSPISCPFLLPSLTHFLSLVPTWTTFSYPMLPRNLAQKPPKGSEDKHYLTYFPPRNNGINLENKYFTPFPKQSEDFQSLYVIYFIIKRIWSPQQQV